MKILLYIFIFVFTTFNSVSKSYSYVSYNEYGGGYYVTFFLKKNILAIADAVQNIDYKDCSNSKFKCMKIDDEFIFVPRNIRKSNSGSFKSDFGNYIVFNNEPVKLPFDLEIDYTVLEIDSNKDKKIILLYNDEKGVIAFNKVYKENYKNGMVWLVSKCGLLADKSCFK